MVVAYIDGTFMKRGIGIRPIYCEYILCHIWYYTMKSHLKYLVVRYSGEEAMIYATSSLEYQYVSGTARRVAVAGIAVYFCAKWSRTPAESLHVMTSLPTYDIIVLDMIPGLFIWYHAMYDIICNIWYHSINMISYKNLWYHTCLWYHSWWYDITTNIWYHWFLYDFMDISMISHQLMIS